MKLWQKKLLLFDLDGTLTKPYSPITTETLLKFVALLDLYKISILTASIYDNVGEQILSKLVRYCKTIKGGNGKLQNLHILTCYGNRLHKYNGRIFLPSKLKAMGYELANEIVKVLKIDKFLVPNSSITIRDSLITYKPFAEGTDKEKADYDPNGNKRLDILRELEIALPQDTELFISGRTSIDIVDQKMNKADGARHLMNLLDIKPEQAVYFGDSLRPYWSDYPLVNLCDTIEITYKSIDSMLDKLLKEKK